MGQAACLSVAVMNRSSADARRAPLAVLGAAKTFERNWQPVFVFLFFRTSLSDKVASLYVFLDIGLLGSVSDNLCLWIG